MKFSALGSGAAYPAARQIRTFGPGQLPRLKTPLTSLFFAASVSRAVIIKTDINFSGTFPGHPPGPAGVEIKQR